MSDFNQNTRKKLIYRSLKRGCRETDILLGQFANANIASMTQAELALYEQFLDEYDGDIYKWLSGQVVMPEKYNSLNILDFCHSQLLNRHPMA